MVSLLAIHPRRCFSVCYSYSFLFTIYCYSFSLLLFLCFILVCYYFGFYRNFSDLPIGTVCVADVQFKGRGLVFFIIQFLLYSFELQFFIINIFTLTLDHWIILIIQFKIAVKEPKICFIFHFGIWARACLGHFMDFFLNSIIIKHVTYNLTHKNDKLSWFITHA